ncbi:hypothetical protein SAMN05216418_2875 [Microbacterium enclense]|uniref:Uncharacterized protein n=1 Tax=Microbacterium enclense TaxID=993073 RepID=A0A1G6NVP2_9MICO|nr:hypothetical protein AS029_12970 [Microbacterium enclense]SDC72100.1 hypothetical protein SAMN05216418_2875 [Microbacterium enclense]
MSPTTESSTVAQWASLIAQQKAEWDDWAESWDDSECSPAFATTQAGIICRVQLTSATFMATTTTIEHQLAVTPGKKGFIASSPPAEVSSLFAQTKTAAETVQREAEAWDAGGCSTTTGEGCASLTFAFDRAIGDLSKAFVGWSPYM